MTLCVVAAPGKEPGPKPRCHRIRGCVGHCLSIHPSIVETIQMNNAIRFPIIAAAGFALTACATDG